MSVLCVSVCSCEMFGCVLLCCIISVMYLGSGFVCGCCYDGLWLCLVSMNYRNLYGGKVRRYGSWLIGGNGELDVILIGMWFVNLDRLSFIVCDVCDRFVMYSIGLWLLSLCRYVSILWFFGCRKWIVLCLNVCDVWCVVRMWCV